MATRASIAASYHTRATTFANANPMFHQSFHYGASIVNADPILSALRVAPELRTEADLIPIVEFVKGLKFFHSFSYYPETVAQIAARLELHSFVNGSHVFHEGEVGQVFYVILDGEVSIYKRKRVQSMEAVLENILLVKLGCGQHFGETALESKDGLRTATAIATKNSNLLVLRREDYLAILSQFKVLLKVAVKKCLSMHSSMFSHLPTKTLETLSEVAVVRSFTPNSTIYIAGTRISSIMIVRSGLVKLIKPISKVDFEASVKEIEKKVKTQSLLPKISTFSPAGTPKKPLRSVSAHSKPSTASPLSYRSMIETNRLNALKEQPPGHWILTRSEDYIAKSKLNNTSSMRENNYEMESNMQTMISNYQRLSISLRNSISSNQSGSSAAHSPVKLIKEPMKNETFPLPLPTPSKIDNNRMASSEQVEFTVAVLMSGDVLGEVSILDVDNITPLTAIASTTVELYCIDAEVLIELGISRDEKIMRALLDDWKFRNPPPAEIRKKFQVKYEWEAKKEAILSDLKR
jgi:CRP-like cAMP-binding protein